MIAVVVIFGWIIWTLIGLAADISTPPPAYPRRRPRRTASPLPTRARTKPTI